MMDKTDRTAKQIAALTTELSQLKKLVYSLSNRMVQLEKQNRTLRSNAHLASLARRAEK